MTNNINTTTERYFTPAVDICNDESGLDIFMDLPGVEKNDVKIEVDENNVLSINAKQSYAEPEKAVLREFTTGNFYRAFSLSEELERDSISASFEDGVLKLHIPRKEEQKPQKIEITL